MTTEEIINDFIENFIDEQFKQEFSEYSALPLNAYINKNHNILKTFKELCDPNKSENAKAVIINKLQINKRNWDEKNSKFGIENYMKLVSDDAIELLNGNITDSEFIAKHSALMPKEVEQNIIDNIQTWRNDRFALLTSYPFFKNLSKKSISTGFNYDIIILFIKYHEENEIEVTPEELDYKKIPPFVSLIDYTTNVNTPMFSKEQTINMINGSNIPESQKTITDNELSVTIYNKTYIEGKMETKMSASQTKAINKKIEELKEYTINSLNTGKSTEANNKLTEIALLSSIKQLNTLDMQLLIYFYNKRELLVSEASTTVKIIDILEDLNIPKNQRNIDSVIDSLIKLRSIGLSGNIEGIDPKKFSMGGENLLPSRIYKDKKDGLRTQVYLSQSLKQLLFSNCSYLISSEQYNNLSEDAITVGIWLQRQMYKSYIEGTYPESIFNILYTSFGLVWNLKGKLAFSRKKKKLEGFLIELQANHFLIEEFSYSGNVAANYELHIKWLPLTENDRNFLAEKDNIFNIDIPLLT